MAVFFWHRYYNGKPKQVANQVLGCSFDCHVSGGPPSSKNLPNICDGNFRHCGKPTRLVAQLTKTPKGSEAAAGKVCRLLTKIFKDKMPPPKTSSQASSSTAHGETRAQAEDRIAMELATDESWEELKNKDKGVHESLMMEVKIEDDDDFQKEHLDRVLRMQTGFKCEATDEGQKHLMAFDLYEPERDFEHVCWLPHDLMLYALRTDPQLRLLFLEGYVEMENKADSSGEHEYQVKLFLMREYTFQRKLPKFSGLA